MNEVPHKQRKYVPCDHSNRNLRSALSGFFEALPNTFMTPFLWHDDRLEALDYPMMRESLLQQRKEWEETYQRLAATSPLFSVTWDEFVWAMSAVRSRSLRGDIASTLLPVVGVSYDNVCRV